MNHINFFLLDLKSSNKHFVSQNLSNYYWWKNIRKQYKNSKVEIIAPTWNHDFGLSYGSYSVLDIQDCIEYIFKKHRTLTAIPPIHAYITRDDNRFAFKMKDGYKL